MNNIKRNKIEFGDFQTPLSLAKTVCTRLKNIGLNPNVIVEPTCGVGSFILSSLETFEKSKSVVGYEIKESYLTKLVESVKTYKAENKVKVKHGDFFNIDWRKELITLEGELLVIGNFPWVTNSVIASIGGTNLPIKSNFLKYGGFDSISGKANFDISEWMLIEVMSWFENRKGAIAMLVKTTVARKILSYAQHQKTNLVSSYIIKIDAKKEFNTHVDACLLVMILDHSSENFDYDYEVFDSFDSTYSYTVGHRNGFTISNLRSFNKYLYLLGSSPKKWRSGVKHDCSIVMELTRVQDKYKNGFGEVVNLENDYIYPLLKGSDIGSNKKWREKFVIVTQHKVGEKTDIIAELAHNTWKYLNANRELLDNRGSSIYAKKPKFSVFGIGDYAFNDWKIAICAFYKNLDFRLVPPIEGKTVMFDDTVYYISFRTKEEAESVYSKITSKEGIEFLNSLIFFDEKRPIKTSLLNAFDWTKVKGV